MKRTLSLFLAVCIALSVCACGKHTEPTVQNDAASEMRSFTDDCRRTVILPAEVKKVAVSGPLAQMYVLPVCPELMVGFASQFSKELEKYVKKEYLSLPVLGQLYGGKGTLDPEMLLRAAPDVVIDVGEAKGNIAEDLDRLTEQTGIPFVHIDATLKTSPEAFRRLGELTGRTEKAEELAVFCEKTYKAVEDIMAKVDADGARVTALYCLGDKGLNVLAEKSFHAETINTVSKNAAIIDDPSFSGDGNEVDPEQLILWNPDYIIFGADSMYGKAASDEVWQEMDAIRENRYYEDPMEPYGWVANLPSVQRHLGLIWLVQLFYPEYCNFNLQEQVCEFYRLFYDYNLSAEEYAALTVNSLPRS